MIWIKPAPTKAAPRPGGVRLREAGEGVHDAPHRAEQADECRARAEPAPLSPSVERSERDVAPADRFVGLQVLDPAYRLEEMQSRWRVPALAVRMRWAVPTDGGPAPESKAWRSRRAKDVSWVCGGRVKHFGSAVL